MTNSLPGLFRSFALAGLCLALVGCGSDGQRAPLPAQESAPVADSLVAAAVSATGETAGPPVKAEIMDIAQGASGEVCAVAVRFSGGECKPCRVDVHDSSGVLLASDEVRGTPAGDGIHETEFEYKGNRDKLQVTVTDGYNNEVLTKTGQ